MKKTLKLRTLIVFIALLFLLPTLAACGGNDAPPSPDTSAPTNKTPSQKPVPTVTEINLSAEDSKNYTIIMPKACDSALSGAALDLFEDMKDAGFVLKTCTYDGGADEQNVAEDAPEILIGRTNRTESADAAFELRKDDYRIAVSDSRLMIIGGSDEATVAAITYFYENYVLNASAITVLEEYVFTAEYDYTSIIDLTVNGNPIYEYTISTPFYSNLAFNHAVTLLSDTIAEKSAYRLTVNQSETAPKKSIRIEISEGLADCEYSYTMQDDVWTIKATKRTILHAVRNVIALITLDGIGSFDFSESGEGTFLMNSEIAPLPENLQGKLPVALCDQKNNAAVIVDLAASNPTDNSAILWTWNTSGKGFTGNLKNRIDEFKLRYSTVLEKYIVCTTSSSGFMGIAEYPSGMKIWEHDAAGYGPHSIDYLPTGNVAVALSGNGNAGKQEIRLYKCDEDGLPTTEYIRDELISAHGIVWDNEWGVLWALGATELIAYEVGGTPQEPTLTRIAGMGATVKTCGHDLSISATDPGKFYLSSNAVYVFDKYTNTLSADYDGKSTISGGDVKSIAVHTDGSILRAHAANVYAQHDTDTLDVYRKNAEGTWVKTSYKFADRAFYKARPFILC